MCGGTVVEDIDQYNRVHEMLSVLSGKLNRDMDDVSSMSKRWDSDEVYDAVRKNLLSAANNEQDPAFQIGAIPTLATGTAVDLATINTVIGEINTRIEAINDEGEINRRKLRLVTRLHGNESKVLSTKLAFGLLHQPKWIPLRYAPLTLELELVNQFTDVCIELHVVDQAVNPGANSRFPELITSKEWSIEQVEVKCVCVLWIMRWKIHMRHICSKQRRFLLITIRTSTKLKTSVVRLTLQLM